VPEKPQTTTSKIGKTETNQPLKHINFFEDIEREEKLMSKKGEKTEIGKGNSEYEAEKKTLDDRYTPYLGKGSLEAQKLKPWYNDSNNTQNLTEIEKLKAKKRKLSQDPLSDMNKFLGQKKKIDEKKKEEDKKANKKKSLDDLRKERLEREQYEREKVSKILGENSNTNKKNDSYLHKKDDSQYSSGYSSYTHAPARDRFDYRSRRLDNRSNNYPRGREGARMRDDY